MGTTQHAAGFGNRRGPFRDWLREVKIPMPRFDATISLGNILSIGTVLVAVTFMAARMEAVMAEHERRLAALEGSRRADDAATSDMRERLSGRLTGLEVSSNTTLIAVESLRRQIETLNAGRTGGLKN